MKIVWNVEDRRALAAWIIMSRNSTFGLRARRVGELLDARRHHHQRHQPLTDPYRRLL
jgi:hypothetical protein